MGSSKLMMFSEETKNEMSDELRKKFEDYIKDQSSISSTYETLVETQSNVYDLIQYLQSGKMPQLADNIRNIQEEVKYLLSSITTDYKNNFYILLYKHISVISISKFMFLYCRFKRKSILFFNGFQLLNHFR